MRNGFGIFISVGVVLALYLLAQESIPGIIRRNLERTIRTSCESCSISIPHTSFGLFPLSFSLSDIDFKGGDPMTLAADVHIERVSGRVSLTSLVRKEFRVTALEIEKPDVLLTEGDLKIQGLSNGNTKEKWRYFVDSTEIRDAHFVYRRVYQSAAKDQAREALLHVNSIHGHVGPFGNIPSAAERWVEIRARGMLEKSGHFNLAVDTLPFSKKTKLTVNVLIEDQNLADFSSFFEAGNGMKIEGTLLKGRGVAQVSDDQLEGSSEARYRNLKIHLGKTRDRGAIASFFQNLVQSVEIHSNDLDKKRPEQTRKVQLKRDPDEALISFVIRGLQQAALRIATASK
jgi:hypothetical protein